MVILLTLWSIVATLLATAIMSYITMATAIGPWIETIIVLLGIILVHTLFRQVIDKTKFLGLSTAAAGMGGIIATACGFSFPTIYFLDPQLFNSWLAHPVYFCSLMAALVIVASALGLFIAQIAEPAMLSNSKMSFSVGQLVQKMIVAQNQLHKAYELIFGICTSIGIFIAQSVMHIIPNIVTVIPRFTFGLITIEKIAFKLDLFPMFISIGFVAGTILTIPLLIGVVSKIFILSPMHKAVFPMLSYENLLLAFSSGMILQSSIMTFLDLPLFIKTVRRWISGRSDFANSYAALSKEISWYLALACSIILIPFFYYFNFSLLAQIYVIVGTILCIYQILIIAGEIGIAPLGRYATFVMVPGLIIFGFNALQATLVAAFVEIACGVSVDALFGRKMAQLANIERKQVVAYQALGVIVCALSIGLVFWLLITHFGLGSKELFAPRAQPRALLINAYNFNYYVLLIGVIYGFILKYCKINPVLVLGGLVMTIDVSLMLILGGTLSLITKKSEEWYPYWSGVFAASSLLMIFKAMF